MFSSQDTIFRVHVLLNLGFHPLNNGKIYKQVIEVFFYEVNRALPDMCQVYLNVLIEDLSNLLLS